MKKLKTYQFTLVLKNVDASTPNLEDGLYKSGCDDALINFRNNTVYLDFDRKGKSFEKAIISAIKQVESSTLGIIVASVAPDNLVTESEIADRLSMTRQTISLWIKGKRRLTQSLPFPKPVMRLTDKSPLWKWNEVTEWVYLNDIIHDEEIVQDAVFLEAINAALGERDKKLRKSRDEILQKLAAG